MQVTDAMVAKALDAHVTSRMAGVLPENNMRAALTAALAEMWRPTHRHNKRGSEYALIGIGKIQSEHWRDPDVDGDYDTQSVDMREVVIYRADSDGTLWVRPREEFEDGRFDALPRTAEGEVMMARRNFTDNDYPCDPIDISDHLWVYADKKGLCVVMRRPGTGIDLDHVPWSVIKSALNDHKKARSRKRRPSPGAADE